MLTQENQGLARTCNRGAREASGEYFLFLSADDRLEPTYVSELLAALEREPDASFAYCAARLFGAESRVAPSRPFSAFLLVRGRNYINGSALTRRRDYLDAGGYPEDLGEGAFDDWDFWLTMLDHGHRGTYVPKPLLHWRRHSERQQGPGLTREDRDRDEPDTGAASRRFSVGRPGSSATPSTVGRGLPTAWSASRGRSGCSPPASEPRGVAS